MSKEEFRVTQHVMETIKDEMPTIVQSMVGMMVMVMVMMIVNIKHQGGDADYCSLVNIIVYISDLVLVINHLALNISRGSIIIF